ncbi:uncharacterized protein SCHCODRAFT_0107358 [Schizophyllum commune H4-8]
MQPTEQSQPTNARTSQEQPPKQMQMQPAMEMSVVGNAPTSTQPGQQAPMRVRGGGAGKVRYLLGYVQHQSLATAQTSAQLPSNGWAVSSAVLVASSAASAARASASALRTSSAARARCSAKEAKVLRSRRFSSNA